MSRPEANRNLLFGINALQNDFITRDALIAAMNAWVLEKHRAIGDILVERGDLGPSDRDLLDQLIDRHLAKHNGDAAASLAAMSSIESVADDLRRGVADPDVLESITQISPESNADPHATRASETADYAPAHIRFHKVRNHAEGGLGIVFVARDEELNREVALKEIKPKFADNLASQARFLIEAEITGGLEHPGIVPVYGLGHYDDGRPYYAMRFIRGNSLKDAIKAFHADASLKNDPGARTLALQKLLRRFLDVCNAVAYAHNRGVLHRDLKPDNVMVGKYGETLVVDWGLAKAVGRSGDDGFGPLPESTILYKSSSGSAETMPGSVVGTPGYMSPEQAAGRLDLLGPASDVYGLGATLYTLLTGRVPFTGSDIPDILIKVERGEFPRPREHAPWLDQALEAIALKAMALKAEARYASPKALADDVERWIADEPVAAYPEPLARRARRWARKHRTGLTAATATALVAGLLVGLFFAQRSAERWRIDLSAIGVMDESARLSSQAQAGDSTLWDKAAVVAQRAVDQLEAGGSSGRLREARSRLEAIRAEARVIKALEEARLQMANGKDGRFDTRASIDGYLAAFRAYGIDVATLPIEDAARRIRSSRVADDLIATLDDWVRYKAENVPRERLSAMARAVETDPVRAAIREAASRRDAAALRHFCESEDDRRKLGPRVRFLFNSLLSLDPDGSFSLLETILRDHPSNFWLNHDLGTAYYKAKPPKPAEAVHFLSIAVALRPGSPGVHLNLGVALKDQGHLERAVAEFEAAIRIEPELAEAHVNLGAALKGQGHLDRATAEYEAAIRINPGDALAHYNLGVALKDQGHLERAVAEFEAAIRIEPELAEAHVNLGAALKAQGHLDRATAAYEAAIRINPDDAVVHYNLGAVLQAQGHLDRAVVAYETAIRIKPDYAAVHYNLGAALKTQGHLERAVAELEAAIRIKPEFAEAHCNLGLLRLSMGKFAEGLESLEKGHALGSGQPGWKYPSETWARNARRLVDLEAKLPAILKGETTPRDSAERLALADLCYRTGRFATSARFWGEAFAGTPALADDLAKSHRYNAACSASLAASGRSKDEPMPDDPAKAKLREQALGWLRLDLTVWGKVLDGGNEPARKQAVAKQLAHWKEDADLAGIRDEEPLAKLADGEREGFRALWADVDRLLAKARMP
jgi:eukaryotic-like serine/threonine-protein kinase